MCGGGHHTLEGGGAGLWGVCGGGCAPLRGRPRRAAGAGGAGTHSNERKGAVRGDCDAAGVVESCVGADVVVVEASNAAAGEGGGRSGDGVDTADAVVLKVLRCIGREHTLSEEQAGGAMCGGGHHTLEGSGAGLGRVCEAGAPLRGRGNVTTCGVQGATGTHANKREGAALVDCDAQRLFK